MEMYINGSRYVWHVVWVIGGVLVVVGMLILGLHMNERVSCLRFDVEVFCKQREDENERRQLLHGINFDAL